MIHAWVYYSISPDDQHFVVSTTSYRQDRKKAANSSPESFGLPRLYTCLNYAYLVNYTCLNHHLTHNSCLFLALWNRPSEGCFSRVKCSFYTVRDKWAKPPWHRILPRTMEKSSTFHVTIRLHGKNYPTKTR